MSLDPEADLYRILGRCEIGDCWEWTGAIDPATGYGKAGAGSLTDGTRRVVNVHRFVYEQLVGPVGDKIMDHLCRNKRCCNPDHLEPVNKSINALRGYRPLAARKTCNKGHRFEGVNVRPRPSGGRTCVTCQRAAGRASYERRKSVSDACQFIQAVV